MREALPDAHPWRSRVLHLTTQLGLPLSTQFLDHDALKYKLRTRDRQNANKELGPTPAMARTRSASTRTHGPPLDVYSELFAIDRRSEDDIMLRTKRALLSCTSDVALPFVQLCSGHLPDDSVTLSGAHCHQCGVHLCPRACEALPEREREWHHVWHNLVECPTRRHRSDDLEHFSSVALDRLREAPVAQARYKEVFKNVIAHSKRRQGEAVVTTALKQDFLTFLVNPARYMPKGTHCAALRDVVNLITAHRECYQTTEDSDDTSESDFDEDAHREAVAALPASRGKSTASRRRRKNAQDAPRSRATRGRTRIQASPASTSRGAAHPNSARGGRQITPLCPPRRRNRRRRVVADAPTGATATT